jgi:hypothetical protein
MLHKKGRKEGRKEGREVGREGGEGRREKGIEIGREGGRKRKESKRKNRERKETLFLTPIRKTKQFMVRTTPQHHTNLKVARL